MHVNCSIYYPVSVVKKIPTMSNFNQILKCNYVKKCKLNLTVGYKDITQS